MGNLFFQFIFSKIRIPGQKLKPSPDSIPFASTQILNTIFSDLRFVLLKTVRGHKFWTYVSGFAFKLLQNLLWMFRMRILVVSWILLFSYNDTFVCLIPRRECWFALCNIIIIKICLCYMLALLFPLKPRTIKNR